MRPVNHKIITKKEAAAMIATFNEKYPVGTPCILVRDSGQELPTVTRTQAFDAGDGTPVIYVRGIPSYYMLDRVHPTEVSNEPQTA
jgi:hypothetical protein